jgi:uncharacterized protein involved in outer membrane biogenesis
MERDGCRCALQRRKIEHGSTLPISDLSTHIILKNADLRLQPLKFGMAGGTISSNIHLEGDKKPMQGGRKFRRAVEAESADAERRADAENPR